MKRVLEPEIMDDKQQAIAYARADFSQSNQWYVDMLQVSFPGSMQKVLDLGCGPADVPIRLAKTFPDIQITAIDGSGPMIMLAQQAVQAAGLEDRVSPMQGYIPGLAFEEKSFDAVLCKDMIHHLPDPYVLWNETKRLAKPGALVCVMDLYRPESAETARQIVEDVSPDEDPILKLDFYNSLCASFTVEEIEEQLKNAGLSLQVEKVSERHILIKGYLP